jgi:hypothetical protein
MRTLAYISILIPFVLGSCISQRYTSSGVYYDDLYYSSADAQYVTEQNVTYNRQAERNLNVNDYNNNNRYDTIIVVDDEEYYGYYDYSGSYAGRLRMFYGNYFDPYWHDPFYFGFGYGFGYPYYSFGFGFG